MGDDLYDFSDTGGGGFDYRVSEGSVATSLLGTSSLVPPGTATLGAPPGTSAVRGLAPPGRLRTAGGVVPSTALLSAAPRTAVRMGTSDARPMTSVKASGYSSRLGGSGFDAVSAGGPTLFPLHKPQDTTADLEKKVHSLLEESATASAQGKYQLALDRAKEAAKREYQLGKQQDTSGSTDQIGMDLRFSVFFNLAHQYHLCGFTSEALATFEQIVKNRQYTLSGRLRVNMGNIYFEQKRYGQAVKMYRMALDQIPQSYKYMRVGIMRNIGISHLRLRQFQDAIESFEAIMREEPDLSTAFNLVLCYYATGNKSQMKHGFSILLGMRDTGTSRADGGGDGETSEEGEPQESFVQGDALRETMAERKRTTTHFLTQAAKLMAPIVERDPVSGFDYVTELLKSEGYPSIANELEIAKAMYFLKKRNYVQAVETLRAFEKRDQALAARAATNLSFYYFVDNDFRNAEKYASLAVKADHYNAKALINKGNCLFLRKEYEKAKELYQEAINVEADFVEAQYNLGLLSCERGDLKAGLECFQKLQSVVPNSTDVLYHISSIYDKIGNLRMATKWMELLVARVPSDPVALAYLGDLYSRDGDETQALHYNLESYRYYPVNIDVISWLGAYWVKLEYFEKAIPFFERASEVQPKEVCWLLRVASCHRRIGNYNRALEIYEDIHRQWPENTESLRFLVSISRDLGLSQQVSAYTTKLGKLERLADAAEAAAAAKAQEEATITQEVEELTDRLNNKTKNTDHTVDANVPRVSSAALQRPKTAAIRTERREDEWDDDGLVDELLPM